MWKTTVFLVTWVMLAAGPPTEGSKVPGNKGPEGKMTTYQGKLRHPVYAIGGETTGTIIETPAGTYELDLGGKKELQTLARSLNEKPVVVTGVLRVVKGVEIPERRIITVRELRADRKK